MRNRTADPLRRRMTLRLPHELFDDLTAIANNQTFGNRSALVERMLTDAVAAAKASV